MLVSLDGGVTYHPVTDSVRVVYPVPMIPGEDEPGELHLNLTSEGLIADVWVSRDESLDHNLATLSTRLDDFVGDMVA
jgi:hypothetical protein